MAVLFASLKLDLLFVVSTLLLYLYFKFCHKRRYFERHGMQYKKSTFLFGSINGILLKESPSESFGKLYNEMKHMKVGGFFQLFSPNVLLCDPHMVHRVLVKDFQHFRDHNDIHIDNQVNPLEDHLFNLKGNKWKVVRNKLTPAFSSGKLKEMFPLMESCANRMVKGMSNIGIDDDVRIKDYMGKYTCNLIGTCGFGLDLGDIEDDNNSFVKMVTKVFSPNPKMMMKFLFLFFLPKLFNKLKIRTFTEEINNFFISIVKQAFHHRKTTGYYKKDFIQLLMEIKEKGFVNVNPEDYDPNDVREVDVNMHAETVEFTDELLAAQAFIFFLGGFETTGSTMAFALYLLSKNPEVQDKLRNEVREIKAMYDNQITYEGLKKMTYLEQCISETLRIYPPLPQIFRVCCKDYTFDDGSKIEKGTNIFIPIQAMHMDPEYFKEPETFRPERFQEDHITPGTYTAFGEGPRMCIAKRFALLATKLGLAKAIDNFEFRRSLKNIEPFKMHPTAFTLTPIGGVWVKVKKAKENL